MNLEVDSKGSASSFFMSGAQQLQQLASERTPQLGGNIGGGIDQLTFSPLAHSHMRD